MLKDYSILFLFLLLSQVSTAQVGTTANGEPVETELPSVEISENQLEKANAQPSEFKSTDDQQKNPELRQVDKQEWAKLKKDKRFIYKKPKPKVTKSKKKKEHSWLNGLLDFLESSVFKFILYCLLALFLIYIVYLFIKNNDISFSRNIKDEGVQQEDPWEDVQQFDNWELALQEALRERDYRLATRIYYLHTLHLLDKKNVIKYRDDKTNWYYVQKLFGTQMHDDFKGLTQNFDYIWYGEYQIDPERFDSLQAQFKQFQSTIA